MHSYQIDNLIASSFTLIVFGGLLALAARALRRSVELRHELRLRFLERCSATELVEILSTADGREWMGRFLNGGLDSTALDESTLRRAVVLIGVGLACIVGAATHHFPGAAALAMGGSIAVACGLSLLAARWWLARRRRGRQEPPAPIAAADPES